ncbi:hypothetical protein [Sanyastnella coralliicola]|uniref:hypothetical protein n=1 Tax=Sanyastnella coralliicola TaxID=3069118 RepID=UPI0027BA5A3F|nr:hypothetical protein [Longitalea sp. SCSIO 12813]
MHGKYIFLLVVFGLIGAYSCSTEIDVNAPYDSKTVVFGILEPEVDTQWVKITRTWLGEGNNFDAAMVRDSSEYPEGAFTGVVEEWIGNSIVQTYPLFDTLLENKSTDGIFYAPEHTAYYCLTPNGLNNDALYRINLDFTSKDDVEATADVVEVTPGSISFPPAISTFEISWATVAGVNTVYNNQTFEWNSSPNAKRYEASLDIYLTENVWADASHTELVESRPVVLNWFIGTRTTADINGGEQLSIDVNGEAFYRFLESRLTADPMVTREFGIWDDEVQFSRAIDFVLTIANEELDTYLEINEPVTNIVQERPSYTNVTNGLGIWASRTQQSVDGVGISTGSLKALVEGEFTADLNFCSSNPFNEYSCD